MGGDGKQRVRCFRSVLLLLVVGPMPAACATILTDSVYTYEIDTLPTGAHVTVYQGNARKIEEFSAPGRVQLDLAETHYIKVSHPSYATDYVQIERGIHPTFLLSFALVFPAIIDLFTGAYHAPTPGGQNLVIELAREP